ncbi:DUF6786 family protein [candidate division KSB1 bacterium]
MREKFLSGTKNTTIIIFSVCFISMIFLFLLCQQAPATGNTDAKSISSLISVIEGTYSYNILEHGNNVLVVSPEIGGRIMGVSIDGLAGKNLLWADKSLYKKDMELNASGGHRSWIAPEDGFFYRGNGEWFVQKSMDPGMYNIIKAEENYISLSNKFVIREGKGNLYDLELKKDISVIDNVPLQNSDLPPDIKFLGYNYKHSLVNLSKKTVGKDVPFVGLWSLIQVNPPGTMIIPVRKSHENEKPYNVFIEETFTPERMALNDNVLSFKIDGKKREKYGITSEFAGNYIAYLSPSQELLIIKKFDVDPKGHYVDGLWHKPREKGDVIQMYNSESPIDGFAEMECHGPVKTLKTEEEETHSIDVYIFCGNVEKLKIIGSEIMGIDLNNVVCF